MRDFSEVLVLSATSSTDPQKSFKATVCRIFLYRQDLLLTSHKLLSEFQIGVCGWICDICMAFRSGESQTRSSSQYGNEVRNYLDYKILTFR